jgi:trimeric autotransporter adhesin
MTLRSLRSSSWLLFFASVFAAPAYALSLSSPPEVHASPTQVTVYWETDVSGTSELHFGTASQGTPEAYPSHSVSPSLSGTRHSRTLSGLQPGVLYYFRVRSSDGTAAPAAVSAEGTFSVPDSATRPLSRWVPDGAIQALAFSGSTLFFGGGFREVGLRLGPGVSVDPSTGAVDSNSPQLEGVKLEVHVAIPDGAGGFYVGGEFQRAGGLSRPFAVRLLADGGIDPRWAPAPNGTVFALALSGSSVYLGGTFTLVGGMARSRAAAVDATTGTLKPWAPTFNVQPYTFAISGSQLYAAGGFTQVGGMTRRGAAALDLDTAAVGAWNPDIQGGGLLGAQVRTLLISGSTAYVGGAFTTVGGSARANAAAVDLNTGALQAWDPFPNMDVRALAIAGGAVLMAGTFSTVNGGTSRLGLAAVNPTTGAATSWNPAPDGHVFALMVSGNTVYLGGAFRALGATPRRYAAAVDATTGAVGAWNPHPNGSPQAFALSGGALFMGGQFSTVGPGTSRGGAASINVVTGELTAWDPQLATGSPVFLPGGYALAVTGSTVYVGGRFTQVRGGVSRSNAAAFDATSGAVAAWDPAPNGEVHALAQSGSTVYLAGTFSTVNGGTARDSLAAVDATSGAASSWVYSGDLTAPSTLSVRGGNLYAAGNFTLVHPSGNRVSPVAFDTTSGLLAAWNPNPNLPARAVGFSGSNVFLGGSFANINGGVLRQNVAAVDDINGTALSWQAQGTLPNLNRLGVFDGALYLCGDFNSALSHSYVLDTSSGATQAFNGSLDQSCYDLAYEPTSKTLAMGGTFRTAGGVAQSHLVLFSRGPLVPAPDGGSMGAPNDGGSASDAGGNTTDGGIADAGGSNTSDGGTGPDPTTTPGGCGCQTGGERMWLAILFLMAAGWRALRRSER